MIHFVTDRKAPTAASEAQSTAPGDVSGSQPAPTAKSTPGPIGGPVPSLDATSRANFLARADLPPPPPSERVVDIDSTAGRGVVRQALEVLRQNGVDTTGFVPHAITTDALGMQHVRFNRTIGNIPVFGEQAIVHLGGQNTGTPFYNGNVAPIALNPNAMAMGISAREAVRVALESEQLTTERIDTLECYFKNEETGEYERGWQVVLYTVDDKGTPKERVVFVSSQTSQVVQRFEHVHGLWVPRPVDLDPEVSEGACGAPRRTSAPHDSTSTPARRETARDDVSLYSGIVALRTKKTQSDKFILLDESRGKGIHTRDANNTRATTITEFEDDNDKYGEVTDDARQQGAVDAHFGAQTTYDTLRFFGIDSIDLKGAALISNVHVNRNYVNAFWDGKTMNYGDGDGRTASILTTLDIAGHEIAHGLTEHTAGLKYWAESGGLNESYSDIMGFLVEWYAAQTNPELSWDWAMGEDCWTPNNGNDKDALRYLNDPTADNYSVDHYSKYPEQTEVHGSSGIQNQAFYQLAETDMSTKTPNSVSGVVVEGAIGIEKAARIFLRALLHYLTPNAKFADARAACVQAATDLYGAGSVEVQKTKEAWAAVGVGTAEEFVAAA